MKNSSTVRLNITRYGSGDEWPLPADFVFAVDSSGNLDHFQSVSILYHIFI
jgi:hypothetical protein